jgi:low temperature requirement protein LtrA
MTEETSERPEPRVSWAELFFDLVLVFAVTEVSTLLRADHTPLGVVEMLVVFVPIYWSWVGACIHANTHDVDNPADRLAMFAIGLCGLFMALAVPGSYGGNGVLFGAAYLVVRVLLALMVRQGGVMDRAPYRVGALLSGPMLLIGGFLPDQPRLILWGIAAVIELVTPTVVKRSMSDLRFAPAHMAERFGCFLIIALGESVVDLGSPAATPHTLGLTTLAAVAVAFTLTASLWWVYFAYAAPAMHHALTVSRIQIDVVRSVLSYGHLVFVASIIALAVGMGEVIATPLHPLDGGMNALLFLGCALYLATFGYTRWVMFRKVSYTRLTSALAVLVLLPAGRFLPAIAALGLLAAVTVVLNLYEYLKVRRAGG